MTPAEIAAWRRAKRAELLARRQDLRPEDRKRAADIIASKLDRLCADTTPTIVGLYWPIQQEPSLLPWGRALAQHRQISLCLPVVVRRQAPLEYWRWAPGEATVPGFWNIPVPAHRDRVMPDLILAPLVGFDRARYRLGYGGGYFDRTLAALPQRAFVVGVGYQFGALETIFPQPHDIAMDAIATDATTDARARGT
ncbi:MAG TPA: 5-formyltetrahydrofolate cyclo-ligase [Acetobacteraceae bacterium]|jgi:5-formyltetrahydrofolate cyclo-ligase|nr:5-formyltetrahydrofolate cyclo-ligase [Acetobacteraceae bacterium]